MANIHPQNFQNQIEHAWKIHERAHAEGIELNRGAMEAGSLALKYALLINGAAAVTVLGFIGGLASQGRISIGGDLAGLAETMTYFAKGVMAGTFGLGMAYLTNYCAGGQVRSLKRQYVDPVLIETRASKNYGRAYYVVLGMAILSGLCALGYFGEGVWAVKAAVSNLKPIVQSCIAE